MSKTNEEKWRDEFCIEFHYSEDEFYENPKCTLKWIGYLAAKRSSQVEIDELNLRITNIVKENWDLAKAERDRDSQKNKLKALLVQAKPWIEYDYGDFGSEEYGEWLEKANKILGMEGDSND